jgi:general secretion pathway protein C
MHDMHRFQVARVDVARVVDAHLFGGTGTTAGGRGEDAANAPDTRVALSLSGIIATKDPEDGFAILGEEGEPPHLYRVGAALMVAGGRLFRVFADRVVLDFDGRLETLRLPRSLLSGQGRRRAYAAREDAQPTGAAAAMAASTEFEARQATPAQSLFGSVNAERLNVDGHMAGMVLHPEKRIQRQYGVRDGDLLTAVNGVELTDPDTLADALKSSGKSLSLTFTRDGVQQTKTLQVSD